MRVHTDDRSAVSMFCEVYLDGEKVEKVLIADSTEGVLTQLAYVQTNGQWVTYDTEGRVEIKIKAYGYLYDVIARERDAMTHEWGWHCERDGLRYWFSDEFIIKESLQ